MPDTQSWTNEELQLHLDEWDAIYHSGGTLDIGLNQYPVMFDGDGTKTQTILRFEGNEIELTGNQLYQVDMWFRHHPVKKAEVP